MASMMTTRTLLHAEVFEIAGDQCEHPGDGRHRCPHRAVELAHIFPRGMGHTGYRDYLGNVMAACTIHARSTDDLTSPEWQHVGAGSSFDRRTLLADYVNTRRLLEGWDLDDASHRVGLGPVGGPPSRVPGMGPVIR